jgi:glycerol uptake facilitator-like aquaporin
VNPQVSLSVRNSIHDLTVVSKVAASSCREQPFVSKQSKTGFAPMVIGFTVTVLGMIGGSVSGIDTNIS